MELSGSDSEIDSEVEEGNADAEKPTAKKVVQRQDTQTRGNAAIASMRAQMAAGVSSSSGSSVSESD